ncbi:MAG: endonuclease/exonuclease/phosphatase family protein [Spirochaetia bacterium]|nr:endonuclease/exonuclease/phosphatase family protein [Spirochaetia bacterium]
MVVFFLLIFCLLFSSCQEPQVSEKKLVITNWNVQNLMDTNVDGSEYQDFSLEEYGEESYRRRLKNVSDIIDDLNSDIVILEEIENSNVLRDLMDLYLSRKGYQYYGAIKEENSAIAIGFISKIEPLNIRVHAVENSRSVLSLDFNINDEILRIIACHAKSQIEGFEETEYLRINLTKTLKRVISESQNMNVVCVGDFNEDPSIYCDIQTALYDIDRENAFYFKNNGSILVSSSIFCLFEDVLYAPQFDYSINKSKKGTYVYKDKWYNFDLALLNNQLVDLYGLEFSDFDIYGPQKISTSSGIPYAWNSKSLSGVSDHFPICLTLKYLN